MSQTVSFRLQDNNYEELQKAATAEKALSVGDYAKAIALSHIQGRSSQLSNIEERVLKTERLVEELRRDLAVSVKALYSRMVGRSLTKKLSLLGLRKIFREPADDRALCSPAPPKKINTTGPGWFRVSIV